MSISRREFLRTVWNCANYGVWGRWLMPLDPLGPCPKEKNGGGAEYGSAWYVTAEGARVKLITLMNGELLNETQIVEQRDLQLPIAARDNPAWTRGFFPAHPAWDITAVGMELGDSVAVLPPHSEAVLVMTGILRGRTEVKLNMGGAVQVYYLRVGTGKKSDELLVTYSHLTSYSVVFAADQAAKNGGRVRTAGEIGDTGYTDGKHIHMQVVDVARLLATTRRRSILDALIHLVVRTAEVDQSIYVNPGGVFLKIKELPFLPPSS